MIQLKEGELLSNHTTFRIGGAAKYFAVPKNEEEIMEAVDFAIVKGLPHYILGKGSNVLFPDEGYSGVVIEIGAGMEKVERIGDTGIRAQAGVSLSSLAAFAAREGLAGLEFAGGIPGTLGGAVTMNAGAYGGEMKDVIVSAEVMDEDGGVKVLSCDELELGYRTSIRSKRNNSSCWKPNFHCTGRDRGDSELDERTECKTKRKTAVGISECRKYV